MEAEDQEYADTGGSGVMVSNLPLLFSGGSPSSLRDMAQNELEVFVPFMVRCSVGEERPVPWYHLPRPPWWPKKLPFRMPPSRSALIGLVERCYSFHGCEYLLQFCASLVAQMPSAGYRFNDNRDGTTSMYHGSTGKLLVTFRNENRDYDKFQHSRKGKDAIKKLLLSPTSGSGGGGGGSSAAIIQPDIYLCDKCENEFYSLKEVKAHERHCCGEVPSSPPTPSPEPEVPEEEPEPTGQVPFLSYFNLRPAQHTGLEPHMSPRKKSVSSPPAKLPGPIYPRYDTIALSSPLGRYLFAHSKFRSKYQASQHAVMRYERHLHATPNADINYRERCTSRWIVVWRSRKEQQPWVHLYCFNRAQRRERMITLRTGLTKESRRLLRLCRPLKVRVKRMPKRTVDRLLRLGTPNSAPCIDLTDEQQHLVVGQPLARPLDPPLTYWVSPGGGSSLGHSTMEFQWVTGLPEQSGTLAPHYASQLGTGNMVGLTVGHHSSLNLLPMVPGAMQHQHQLPSGLTIQPSSLSSRPLLPLAANNSHFKVPQNVPVEDSLGRLHYPLTPDVSISPIGGPAQPTRSQLEADFMKPLSRKKFPHLSFSPAVPQFSRQQVRPAVAFPASQHLHPVPPQPPDWERVPHVGGGEGNSLPHTHPSSSIEVIDLSSDEDDYSRVGRSRSEAANAPQQLDGLACYPHTGAKVPSESSEYSLSKNGNSHWSSQQKSHCGAGRVGDLATNGQPPNVPPSPTIPHPCPDLSPSPSPSPEAHRPIENMRKRKIEEDVAPHGEKTIVLDLCSRGMVVSKVNRSLSPTTSTSEHCDLPHKEHWRSGEVSTSSLPDPTVSTNQTNFTSDTFSSLQVDQGLPASQPGCVQHQGSQDTQGSLWKEAMPRIRFLNSLVNKGVEFFRSFMSKDSKALRASTGSPRLGRGHRRRARARPASTKVSFEVQKLLRDECRELRRSGLRELSHLDPQGIRLTRRTVGHILPGTQPTRKNLGPRLGENCPPNRNSSKAKKEEGRGGHREAAGWDPVSLKGAAFLTMDENGNSASYVQTDTKQPASSERPGLALRDESGWGVAAEAPRQWKVGATSLPSPVDKSDTKFGSGNVTGKSTVFSELSVRNSEVLVNSCSGARGNSVNNNLQYAQCTSTAGVVNSILTPTEVDAKKRNLSRDSVLATRRMNSFAWGTGRPIGVPTGKAAVGEKVTPGTLWDADNTTTSVCSVKTTTTTTTTLPRLTKDLLSLSPTAARPELTGKTAEECGAQLAQCPLPDQLQHYPVSSGTPLTTHSRPHLTLLNSIRTSPASKHPVRPHSPDQQPPLYLSASAKPQSTNQRKRAKLHRELINLGRDEYKEIRGTGFHPSDFLGHEEVKYLSTSSDEDEAPSPSTSLVCPQPARSAGGRARARKSPQSTKVSREVARLLKDECKELQDRQSGKDKCDRTRERGRCRSMHPQAKLTHTVADDLEVWGSSSNSRCSTRSQVNTQPVVEIFTPRDSHRHLLRSEVAMCVLNYELPNIH